MCIRDRVMALHGYFDDRADERRPSNMTYPMLGRMSDIPAYVRQHNIKMIVISQPISAQPRIMNLLEELEDTTASVYFLPDIYIFDLMQARFASLGGMPVIGIRESPFTGFNSMIKRISDIVLALIRLIMLLKPVKGDSRMPITGMPPRLAKRACIRSKI